MSTSVDVAVLAGVSQATVSRVLSGHPAVKPETRERVMNAMRSIGYRPNLAARSMKTSRIGTVGVVVARLSNPLYPELLQHLGAELQRDARQMLVWHSESGGEQAAVSAASHGLVDGIIFAAATSSSMAAIQEASALAPVVLAHRSLKGAEVDQVEVDNAAGARLVSDLFFQANKRHIAIAAGDRTISTVRVREDAFRLSVKKRSGGLVAEGRVNHASYEEGFRVGKELAGARPRPDAVFCVNDVIALGVLGGLRDSGMRVPEDIWVAGFDDVAMASWSSFQLTTVHQPLQEIAQQAVQCLLERLAGNEGAAPRRVVLKPSLRIRATAGATEPSLRRTTG